MFIICSLLCVVFIIRLFAFALCCCAVLCVLLCVSVCCFGLLFVCVLYLLYDMSLFCVVRCLYFRLLYEFALSGLCLCVVGVGLCMGCLF